MAYDLSKAKFRASIYGYTVVQRVSFDDPDDEIPGNPTGWTDHRAKRCYVFVDKLANLGTFSQRQAAARKIAMHEVGHARWKARSRSIANMHGWWKLVRRQTFSGRTNQAIEEDYCEAYSKCIDPQPVGYNFLPTAPSSTDLARVCKSL